MSRDIEQLDRSNFSDAVERTRGPVVVEFRADWCEICREFESALENLADEFDGVDFYTVDIEQESRLANNHGISDLPTFEGYIEGNMLKRLDRPDSPEAIRELIEHLVGLPEVG